MPGRLVVFLIFIFDGRMFLQVNESIKGRQLSNDGNLILR